MDWQLFRLLPGMEKRFRRAQGQRPQAADIIPWRLVMNARLHIDFRPCFHVLFFQNASFSAENGTFTQLSLVVASDRPGLLRQVMHLSDHRCKCSGHTRLTTPWVGGSAVARTLLYSTPLFLSDHGRSNMFDFGSVTP